MPEVVILGSAQDGGVPHAGCLCPNCQAARERPELRRRPASIGLRSGDQWLVVDTTQAFEEQMHMIWSRRPSSAGHEQERYPAPETIILTHAHTGHYTGLWQLDKSVLAARGTSVLVPPLTARLLRENEPWKAMIRDGYIVVEDLEWETGSAPISGVMITPVEIPHRSEWPTDTAALLVEGPESSLLYLPDIDFWDEWDREVTDVVANVDIALLDGSFWERPTSPDVPHPPVVETMDRLQGIVDDGVTRVVFTHLNHSNPVVATDSPERRDLERRGYEVARDGMAFEV